MNDCCHGFRYSPFADSPFAYTGEWWENEVGLLHLRARWYLPETGTFLSVDPVESEPPYQYVRGNPANRIDPSGMQCPGCPQDTIDFLKQLYKDLGFEDDLQAVQTLSSAMGKSYFTTEDDGVIFGSSHGITQDRIRPLLGDSWGELELIDECIPASGWTHGIEVVYDFKHQERGIFYYSGKAANVGTLYSNSLVGYVGKTRGFAAQTYEVGVSSYKGAFGSLATNVEIPGINLVGVTKIDAAPLDPDDNMNVVSTGVFATYYGVSVGGGLGAPINGDLMVTNYTLLARSRYGVPPGGEFYLSDPIKYQKSIVNRTIAAVIMTNEIRLLGGGPLNRFVEGAIGQLWSFVHRP